MYVMLIVAIQGTIPDLNLEHINVTDRNRYSCTYCCVLVFVILKNYTYRLYSIFFPKEEHRCCAD